MKVRFDLFQLLAVFGIVLTLSLFCFAQLAVADILEDNAALLGRADAQASTSKLLWFSIGCGAGTAALYLMIIARQKLSFGGLIAGILIGLSPTMLTYVGNAPPAAHLAGKSPNYVRVYVAAYEEEKQRIKKMAGNWGGILGVMIGALIGLSIASQS